MYCVCQIIYLKNYSHVIDSRLQESRQIIDFKWLGIPRFNTQGKTFVFSL